MAVKMISILGATGSVGQSTAAVILSQPDRFAVQAVTAYSNAEALAAQARSLNARHAVVADPAAYEDLKILLADTDITVAAGREALLEAAAMPCELVMAAITGFDGLEPIMKAIEAGANIAIANKEPLVAAGSQVIEAAQRHGVSLLPVDSEHNAVFQVFDEGQKKAVERIILTASGGPFRTMPPEELESVTPEQAVKHPNWSMGRKISVDSATLMNKALEIIEAAYLFDMPADKVEAVIHPQSIIHSMVEYADGSVLAQMGAPDMQTPIAYCLGWPERMASPGQKLNFNQFIKLEIEPIDKTRFSSISLAYHALEAGQSACIAFNAANEVAVRAFLERQLPFTGIVTVIETVLDNLDYPAIKSLIDVISFDKTVREATESYIMRYAADHDKKVYAV